MSIYDDVICAVAECSGGAQKRGFCLPHYERWRRHGDPTAGRVSPGVPRRYLETVVLRHNEDSCLFWPYAKYPNGYAEMVIDGKPTHVGRVVCERVNGAPSDVSLDAAHSCGNGHLGCVAPRHLAWKTHAENMLDMRSHGTGNRGEAHSCAKLTKADVRRIRSLRGQMPQKLLAKEYGVGQDHISRIQAGHYWHDA